MLVELLPEVSVQVCEVHFMAMSTGGSHGQKAEINMTPMIDVLLVLIIIFMVITPVTSRGLDTVIPQPSTADAATIASSHPIVITVGSDHTLLLNAEPMNMETLGLRLAMRFKNGAGKVVFVRGDKGLELQQVAEVIDLAKGAGVDRVGLMTQ
jgi:biopolymer transport protein TolR